MISLADFGIGHFVTWLLVLARTAGVFVSAPVLGNTHVPVPTRIALAACLAFIFTPLVAADRSGVFFATSPDLPSLAASVVKEAVVGVMIGFVGMLLFMVVQSAADMINLQMGLGFGSLVDPTMNQPTSVVGQFHHLVATLLFLATNAHHLLLRGLADSFNALPLGELALGPEAGQAVVGAFSRLFVAGIKIGGPIVGVILLTDVALGILSRTMPQLNVLVVGFPAKILVGLVTVVVALPAVSVAMQSLFGGLPGDIRVLMSALAR